MLKGKVVFDFITLLSYNSHSMNKEHEQDPSGYEGGKTNFARWLENINFPGPIPPDLPKELFPFGREGGELEGIRFNLNQEGSKDTEKESLQKEKSSRLDGFEPFVDPEESQEDNLFVNNYGGAYSQKMELNRKGVERALQIAHLDGKVFLSSLSGSRSRAEAQGNELAARRFLIFDRKNQKTEEENLYKRVASVPEGWKIEINDQRITDELMEKRLAGEELQKEFIGRFNTLFKQGIRESVWREKMSSEKDDYFRHKLLLSIMYSSVNALGFAPISIVQPSFYISAAIGTPPLLFSVVNSLSRGNFGRINIDKPWEVFMPPVEVDKVARTYAYLGGKGRRLVREAK